MHISGQKADTDPMCSGKFLKLFDEPISLFLLQYINAAVRADETDTDLVRTTRPMIILDGIYFI